MTRLCRLELQYYLKLDFLYHILVFRMNFICNINANLLFKKFK